MTNDVAIGWTEGGEPACAALRGPAKETRRVEAGAARPASTAVPLATRQRLPQLRGQRVGQVRPAVELRGGVLEEGDAPLAVAPGGDEGLHRVELRVEVRLPGRHH